MTSANYITCDHGIPRNYVFALHAFKYSFRNFNLPHPRVQVHQCILDIPFPPEAHFHYIPMNTFFVKECFTMYTSWQDTCH
ncbi:hypothetical protein LguiA_024821 [Lonicera macranthoides]